MAFKVVVPAVIGRYESMVNSLQEKGCEVLRLPAPEPGKPLQWTPELINQYFADADAFVGSFAGLKITREVLQAGKKLQIGRAHV